MKTIALRFADKFAPKSGTIAAHQELINKNGYVWYGKLGSRVSNESIREILSNETPRILLIHSGTVKRYWMYVDKIQYDKPELEGIPDYYRDMTDKFSTWFRVIRIEDAPRDIMSKCMVVSSGTTLGSASKYSMSPMFRISTPD